MSGRSTLRDKRWKHERKFETWPAFQLTLGDLVRAAVPWASCPLITASFLPARALLLR
jgi:hypothetical protein